MKIAIIGYGKMGHVIEKTALQRGHSIVCVIDKDNTGDFASEAFASADVAIEFSTPATAVDNILASFAAGVPVVSGTTGWSEYLPELQKMCAKGEGTLLWASNFSIGVNLFRAVNRYLARLMNRFPQYSASLEETHHIHKLDHPSGTAVTIAEEIVEHHDATLGWEEVCFTTPEHEECRDLSDKSNLPVTAIREGEVPGIHTVRWESSVDNISVSHSAKGREGFALGAVLAAEWIKDKKGYFNIGDFLNLD